MSVNVDELFEQEDCRPLSESQIREMASSGLVEFASHSLSHYMLASCERATVRTELQKSKTGLETLTGSPCRTFVLPGGSYDFGVLEDAFLAGYEWVLKSNYGPKSEDPRLLTRYGVFKEDDIYRFADMVHGPVSGVLSAPRRFAQMLKSASSE